MLASFARAVLFGAQLARGLDIALMLYTDHACSTPSASNPNVTLGLNVCAVTTGLESFILTPVPCTSGNVAHWVFSDVACGDVSSAYYHGANDNNDCFAAYDGAMAALMLTCDGNVDELEPSRPTSTTTIAVGPVATSGASMTAPAAPSSTSSASGLTGTGGNNGSSTTSSGGSGWNSLDLGTRIGIIIALAVGIPPILIGLYALSLKKKKDRRGREEEQIYPLVAQPGIFRPRRYPLVHLQYGIPFQAPQNTAPPQYMPGGMGA
jgi:hypothetical protein